jgi:hypothetical protein
MVTIWSFFLSKKRREERAVTNRLGKFNRETIAIIPNNAAVLLRGLQRKILLLRNRKIIV